MSTSLLYHSFGICGYQYLSSTYERGMVFFRVCKRKTDFRSSDCGSPQVIGKGSDEHRFNTVPIGSKPVVVVLTVQRLLCLVCGALKQIKIDFADPRRSYTRQLNATPWSSADI